VGNQPNPGELFPAKQHLEAPPPAEDIVGRSCISGRVRKVRCSSTRRPNVCSSHTAKVDPEQNSSPARSIRDSRASGQPNVQKSADAIINGLLGFTNYPPWMMNIARMILRPIFAAVRMISCYAILGIAGALRFVWPKAEYLRWLVLGSVGMRKLEEGAIAKATRFAEELIQLSRSYKDDWNYGNAIHKGNLILGRIALREGKIETAKQHLVYAGETPGSPQLDSFGPNMSLAKELLEAGEKEVVLDYFRLCKNFWAMDFGKLRKWAEIVQCGRIPNFGAHLQY
jgi:hypothetical protein